MKKLVLYSSNVTNAGGFVDAGTTIEVGDGEDQIAADRAQQIADGGRGASATAAAIEGKAAPDPLDHDGDGRKGGSLPRG